MSPSAAWHSDIFRTYVVLVGSLLLVAGLALSFLTWVLKKNVTSIWATYRGWLVMIPLVVGCLFVGRTTTILLFSLLSLAGFHEFARATGLERDRWLTIAGFLGITAVSCATLVKDTNTGLPGWYGLFMALPVFVIAAMVTLPILRNRAEGQLQTVSLAVVGFIYIGWMFGHAAFLTNCPQAYGYLLYLVFAVEANDIAAFTCGKLLGHRKLRSNISPNKTWGGALGAFAFSMTLPWLLWFSFPHFGPTQLLLTGLIVGVGGQLGDLAISFIKRDVGVKDMGAAIPGHGGILDRVDSLIYVAPLFLHLVNYSYKHW